MAETQVSTEVGETMPSTECPLYQQPGWRRDFPILRSKTIYGEGLDEDSETHNKSKIDFPGVQEVETFPCVIQSIKMQMQKKKMK